MLLQIAASQIGLQDGWRGFTVKVSDFGLSKLMPDGHTQPCDSLATDDVAGTVTHMAPELLAGGRMSPAADVYAFGILSTIPWCILAACARLHSQHVTACMPLQAILPFK